MTTFNMFSKLVRNTVVMKFTTYQIRPNAFYSTGELFILYFFFPSPILKYVYKIGIPLTVLPFTFLQRHRTSIFCRIRSATKKISD